MKYLLPFKQISKEDVAAVGLKGAVMGEITQVGIPIPQGYVITTSAYFDFLKQTGLQRKIEQLLAIANNSEENLREATNLIRKAIEHATVPTDIISEIKQAYVLLGQKKKINVTIQPSPTTDKNSEKNIPSVQGLDNIVGGVRKTWSSLFTEQILYQGRKQISTKVGMAIIIQSVVEAEASGVAFSIDPLTKDKTKIVAESIYGLGEMLDDGSVSPDYFEFDKKSLALTYSQIGLQDKQMVRVNGKAKIITVSKAYMTKPKVSDEVVKNVASYVKRLESHFISPLEVNWSWNGKKLYIVQVQELTSTANNTETGDISLPRVLQGVPGSPGLSSGRAVIVNTVKEINKVQKGDVLVIEKMSDELLPALQKAAALVTDQGGKTSPAAIISQKLGIPAVVGGLTGTKCLSGGQIYTVNGTTGGVYSGFYTARSARLDYEKKPEVSVAKSPVKTATKIMVTTSDSESIATIAAGNIDGVGLLQAERLITQIGVHPKYLIKNKQEKGYVGKIVECLVLFCEVFGNRPVIYRTAALKSNEYRSLKGGVEFEEFEENPALGLRGASRYIKDPEVFGLELEAIKKVRNVHGYKNLSLAIPFVRTPKELASVKQLVAAAGLHRNSSFKLYMMAEIPTNVLILSEYAKVGIDGMIADSAELLQLLLGVDNDHRNFLQEQNSLDESLLWCLEKLGLEGKKLGLEIGIYDYDNPKSYEKLVNWGYTFISVNPDNIDQAREFTGEAERRLVTGKERVKAK
jgi:pyruvate,water dikinase